MGMLDYDWDTLFFLKQQTKNFQCILMLSQKPNLKQQRCFIYFENFV